MMRRSLSSDLCSGKEGNKLAETSLRAIVEPSDKGGYTAIAFTLPGYTSGGEHERKRFPVYRKLCDYTAILRRTI